MPRYGRKDSQKSLFWEKSLNLSVAAGQYAAGIAMEKEYLELNELLGLLREGIEDLFPGKIWVRAEIASVNARSGGHCYLELVQNDGQRTLAKARATVWASKWRLIRPYFESVAGTPLRPGMEILVQVQMCCSELYGFSLNVTDINPEFSLGKKEDLRRRTMQRLEEEGLMERQKALVMPPLPYRFAVITSETAAGYGDFTRHLAENVYGFSFDTELYPALMQGSECPASVAAAMEAVLASGKAYDAVLILRGGGSELDLACFDDYTLCRAIALCPLPVLTAVGHERDSHICDMVAFRSLRTPTALADELVETFADADAQLTQLSQRIRMAFINRLHQMESQIEMLSLRIHAADPRTILSRGYTLVLDAGGKPRRSAGSFRPGDALSLMFADGTVGAVVQDVEMKPAAGEKS